MITGQLKSCWGGGDGACKYEPRCNIVNRYCPLTFSQFLNIPVQWRVDWVFSPASNLVSSHQSRSGSFVSRVSRYLVFVFVYLYFYLAFVFIPGVQVFGHFLFFTFAFFYVVFKCCFALQCTGLLLCHWNVVDRWNQSCLNFMEMHFNFWVCLHLSLLVLSLYSGLQNITLTVTTI